MNRKPQVAESFVAATRCSDVTGYLWWFIVCVPIVVGGCGVLGLGGSEPCATPPVGDAERAVLEAAIARVDEDRLRADVAFLASAPRHPENAEHLEASRDYIKTSIEAAGLEARSLSRTTAVDHLDGSSTTSVIMNIFCEIPGVESDLPLVVLGAHYDTLADSPGADDNASGVAALLEAVRVLSSERFRRTIWIVFFDLEEVFTFGARLFVNELQANGSSKTFLSTRAGTDDAGVPVEAMLNVDMVGYTNSAANTQTRPAGLRFNLLFPQAIRELSANQNRGDFLSLLSNADSSSFSCHFERRTAEVVPELKVIKLTAPSFAAADDPEFAVFGRGDHARFWEADIPAIFVTDTAEYRNPHYHKDTDVPETLDYAFLAKCTEAIVTFAGSLAEPR